MRVAVTDACIFIDLIELDLVASFFKLDVELKTTEEESYLAIKFLPAYLATEFLSSKNFTRDWISNPKNTSLILFFSIPSQKNPTNLVKITHLALKIPSTGYFFNKYFPFLAVVKTGRRTKDNI